MFRSKQWIILFGGAGREACVERLFAEVVNVVAIVVPRHRSAKLDRAVIRLKALPCEFIEVNKAELATALRRWEGSAVLSIGFPYLIDETTLALFKPRLNVHPTLLPRYRGPTSAAYILINNEKESGSTIHHMTRDMDRGDIVAQSKVPVTTFDTVRSLQRKVYASEIQLVMDALAAVETGVKPLSQDEGVASEFPRRRTPADSEIDPSLPLLELFNQIRACDPDEFPAFFFHQGEKVCVRLWRPEKPEGADDEV